MEFLNAPSPAITEQRKAAGKWTKAAPAAAPDPPAAAPDPPADLKQEPSVQRSKNRRGYLQCDSCDRSFAAVTSLKYHQDAEHRNVSFQCSFEGCQKVIASKNASALIADRSLVFLRWILESMCLTKMFSF
jgi:hypothetical protein